MPGDLSDEQHCKDIVEETVQQLGSLQVLVNNVAQQYPQQGLEYITAEQLEKTFRINIFSYFHVAKAALSHLKKGDVIINTASIVAYEGNETLIDYSATKGAIVAFTKITFSIISTKRNSCKWCCAGTDLDTAYSIEL